MAVEGKVASPATGRWPSVEPLSRHPRYLRGIDQPTPAPAHAEEPGAGRRHGWRSAPCPRSGRGAPAVEPATRRTRVDARGRVEPPPELCRVPSRVQEHVRKSVPHLAGRSKNVEVIAIDEHRTTKTEDPVHGAREARSDGLHPRCEVLAARRLHDQMRVIGLDRVVHDSEAPALARGVHASLELTDESHVAQRRKPGARLQRHMARESRSERWPRAVRVSRVQPRLASRPCTAPAPAVRISKIECELSRRFRHRRRT